MLCHFCQFHSRMTVAFLDDLVYSYACDNPLHIICNCWPPVSNSLEVRFQLTENDYITNEAFKRIPAVVNKNIRIANPVIFLLTPFNVSEAERTGQPLPSNIPADDNHLSPNRAKC